MANNKQNKRFSSEAFEEKDDTIIQSPKKVTSSIWDKEDLNLKKDQSSVKASAEKSKDESSVKSPANKQQLLSSLFSEIKATSPIKAIAKASPLKSTPRVQKLTFVIYMMRGFMVAISAVGPGTWHIHRFFKQEQPLADVTNIFGRGVFFTPDSHSRNLNRGNFSCQRSLKVPSTGGWYLIAARDDEASFEEASQTLDDIWHSLKSNLAKVKSLEQPDVTYLEVDYKEEEVTPDLYQELVFTHYNTLKAV